MAMFWCRRRGVYLEPNLPFSHPTHRRENQGHWLGNQKVHQQPDCLPTCETGARPQSSVLVQVKILGQKKQTRSWLKTNWAVASPAGVTTFTRRNLSDTVVFGLALIVLSISVVCRFCKRPKFFGKKKHIVYYGRCIWHEFFVCFSILELSVALS